MRRIGDDSSELKPKFSTPSSRASVSPPGQGSASDVSAALSNLLHLHHQHQHQHQMLGGPGGVGGAMLSMSLNSGDASCPVSPASLSPPPNSQIHHLHHHPSSDSRRRGRKRGCGENGDGNSSEDFSDDLSD